MRRLIFALITGLLAVGLLAPAALGAKPTPQFRLVGCSYSVADPDDPTISRPAFRMTLDWSGARVSRILTQVLSNRSGLEGVHYSDDHVFDRAQRSGSYTWETGPMRYQWNDGSGAWPWASDGASDFWVTAFAGSRVVFSYVNFPAQVHPCA